MSLKKDAQALRACLGCLFLSKGSDFMAKGCPNCEHDLQLQHNRDGVESYTTSQFDGMVAMMKPSESWVAKFQRIDRKVPGLYAVKITGQVPDDVKSKLAQFAAQ